MSIDLQPNRRGRRRDSAIDARVLAAANRQLAARGFEALSLTAVAEEACTTRQALYRRWPSKSSLVEAAIAEAADDSTSANSDDPRHDLELELADFRRSLGRPGAMSLAATMLQESTNDESRACYRAHVITPRRQRIRDILERARQMGRIAADADIEAAAELPTGSLFAAHLAGKTIAADWTARMAALVWRSVGGVN